MKKNSFLQVHELIQAYFDKIYHPFKKDIERTTIVKSSEIYGELYYYGVIQLLKYLDIKENDHFLDIGSGLGKLIFQIYLITNTRTVTGIEINPQRHLIACDVAETLRKKLPDMFHTERNLNLVEGDFLNYPFDNIHPPTMAYVCATVFSAELIESIGKKLNDMGSIQKVISSRRLPCLTKFNLTQKIFAEATWDTVAYYLYTRKIHVK